VSGRRLRELSVVLGMVLMVMFGAIVVVFVSQPRPGPAATASPTAAAGSPTLSPSASGAPTPTPPAGSPTPTGAGTPSAGASPSDSPLPTDTSSLPPTAPQREITFIDLGLDTTDTSGEEPLARYLTFSAEGPGRIEASLSDVSFGRVRMCLWRGDPSNVRDDECQTSRRGALNRDIAAGGPTTWTVSLIGSQAGASPSVTMRLRWPTNDARMHISGFRFQGAEIENYNGFTAVVETAADGDIAIDATFDDSVGGSYPYRLIIEEVDGGPAQSFVVEDEGTSMSARTPGLAERRYRISLEGRHVVAEQRVLITADLDWP
jgi:hypothetical protein